MKMPIIELFCEDKKIQFELNNISNLTNIEEEAFVVYQDKEYSKIVLRNVKNIEEMELLVNNESLDIDWQEELDGYYISVQRNSPLFLLTYGLTEIIVKIRFTNKTEKIYFSPLLSVAVNKRNQDNMESLTKMLEDIYQKNNAFLIKSKMQSKQISIEKYRNQNKIEQEIQCLTSIIQSINKDFVFFANNANVLTETQYTIDSIEKLKNITSPNIQYILMHPEELQKSHNQQGIRIGKQKYIPKKTLISANKYTRNTYENRIVMAFLWTLYVELCKKQEYIEKFLYQNKVELKINQDVEDGYILCSKVINQYIKSTYEIYEKKYTEIKGKLLELYNQYSKVLMEYPVILNKIPVPTSTFLEVNHYRNMFWNLNLWFGREKDTIPHKNLALQFSNADRIYEYYCLLGIYEVLIELGFLEDVDKRNIYKYDIDYSKLSDTEDVNSFYFYKEQIRISLYYQPVIYSKDCNNNNDIALFRVDTSFYTPDFVIKK